MRKIILLAALAISVVGCQKADPTFCWKCTTYVSSEGSDPTTSIAELCGRSEGDISAYVAQHSGHSTMQAGNHTYAVVTNTVCSKK